MTVTPADVLEDIIESDVPIEKHADARALVVRLREGWKVTDNVAVVLENLTGVEKSSWLNIQRRSDDD